ncbi:MAG TPA: branched-chain amino acid ABC transporter permease, partial [Stellaceae bacterium]|nr:branched-chain amino acid ABC transporter permease [Stellaceae bacterium]
MSEPIRRKLERAGLVAILAVVVAVAIGGSRLAVYNFTIIALQAMVVISLNLLLGLAGQVSFAQTTFMAVGGYGSAVLTLRLGLNPWLALFISAFMSLAVALVVGRPLLRLRGHYLAMATFALALGTYSFVGAATPLTNGSIGISGVPPLALGSLSLDSPLSFYVLSWIACGLTMLVYAVIANSYIGRAMRAVATGQDVAAALGVNVTAYKGLAFAIAAVIASLAGSLYVEFTSFVGPDLYDIGMVVNVFLMLFIGGRGSNVGPILGAALLTMAPQYLAGLEQFQNLVFFVFLLVLILVWPAG